MAHEEGSDQQMGKAVSRGVTLGCPAGIVFLTLAVWLITGQSLGQSFTTALLPGVLLGGFAGGFIGLTISMD